MSDPKTTDLEASKTGWLADTPWIGSVAAVFGSTKQSALEQAEQSRGDYISELLSKIQTTRNVEIVPYFVEEDV